MADQIPMHETSMPDDELDSLAYSRRDALADAAARTESDTATDPLPEQAAPRPYADPDLHTDYLGEDGEVELLSAGWDLSFGCRLSFGPEEGGSWRASISMSDEPARVGHCIRTVTPEQVATHAAHLVQVLTATGHTDLLAAALPHLTTAKETDSAWQVGDRAVWRGREVTVLAVDQVMIDDLGTALTRDADELEPHPDAAPLRGGA